MDNRLLMRRIFLVIIPLLALAATLLAGYFYWQARTLKQNPQVEAENEVADLVAKVGKLMVLPEGETPTVATVSDPEALKDQPFFASAVKGDKVLIYTGAKKAILYSVALNKIVDIAPLNIGAEQTTKPSVPPPAPEPPASGTDTGGNKSQ